MSNFVINPYSFAAGSTQDYDEAISEYDPDFFVKLDEGSGTSLTNSGSDGSSVVLTQVSSNPSWVTGFDPAGSALYFNGDSGQGSYDTNCGVVHDSLNAGSGVDFTVMVLVKFASSVPDSGLWLIGSGAITFMGLATGENTGGTADKFHTNAYDGGWAGNAVNSDSDVGTADWHTLGISNDGGSETPTMYYDGVADGSAAYAATKTGNLNVIKIWSGATMTLDCAFYKNSTLTGAQMLGLSGKLGV